MRDSKIARKRGGTYVEKHVAGVRRRGRRVPPLQSPTDREA